MRNNILAINRDAEPTERALLLLGLINKEAERIQIPDNFIFRKVWKDANSGVMRDGEPVYKANSWVMEFYINDYLYEQFYVHDRNDLYKLSEAKEALLRQCEKNPGSLSIAPKEVKTKL